MIVKGKEFSQREMEKISQALTEVSSKGSKDIFTFSDNRGEKCIPATPDFSCPTCDWTPPDLENREQVNEARKNQDLFITEPNGYEYKDQAPLQAISVSDVITVQESVNVLNGEAKTEWLEYWTCPLDGTRFFFKNSL